LESLETLLSEKLNECLVLALMLTQVWQSVSHPAHCDKDLYG